jgi:hypothetical protein
VEPEHSGTPQIAESMRHETVGREESFEECHGAQPEETAVCAAQIRWNMSVPSLT